MILFDLSDQMIKMCLWFLFRNRIPIINGIKINKIMSPVTSISVPVYQQLWSTGLWLQFQFDFISQMKRSLLLIQSHKCSFGSLGQSPWVFWMKLLSSCISNNMVQFIIWSFSLFQLFFYFKILQITVGKTVRNSASSFTLIVPPIVRLKLKLSLIGINSLLPRIEKMRSNITTKSFTNSGLNIILIWTSLSRSHVPSSFTDFILHRHFVDLFKLHLLLFHLVIP